MDSADTEAKKLLTKANHERFEELVTNSLFKKHYEQASRLNKGSLLTQYRMHHEIMDVVNIFYDGQLNSGYTAADEEEKKKHYAVVKDTAGYTALISPEHHAYWIDTSKYDNHFYLVDTCAFLHTPDILSLFEPTDVVRIPFTVLRELDYHKDHQEDVVIRKSAAYACKCIEKALDFSTDPNHASVGVEPRDYPELLPGGFSKTKHDDLILSAAFFYSKANPIILTDDTNFRNIARSQGFSTKPWKEFVEEHRRAAIRTTDPTNASTVSAHTGTSNAVQCEPQKKENGVTDFLSQPIDALSLTPFNLPKKKTKALAAAGYDTLQNLYDATAGEINKKFKSVSMRDLALRTATKLKSEADKLK